MRKNILISITIVPRYKSHHEISVTGTSCRANFLIGVCSSSRNRGISNTAGYLVIETIRGSTGCYASFRVYREYTNRIVIFACYNAFLISNIVVRYDLRFIRTAAGLWIRLNILKIIILHFKNITTLKIYYILRI